ncbi:MAG: 3-deoxy-manno-octulosonate cytidylyltransferase [Candidatus Omnitrophica bacterium]|nr:3-deoxy-manno-octulosonate cytidylyltransferase [Candidatus Omnitrophota bacterium]
MNIIGIIPGRMASSRFPGKPLAKICGIPMIGHVYLRSKMSKLMNEVYVATCDQEIKQYLDALGAKAVMTAATHERASDRAAEAVLKIENETGKKVDIVVMIQGDEPLTYPEMIDEALKPLLEDSAVKITNLMARIKTVKEFEDPNEVKVVVDKLNNALYFSREPIPSRKKGSPNVTMLKQVCIIPFKKEFLLEYTKMKPTPLEIFESVDMMRILENGQKVKMVLTNYETKSVDTLADLETVSAMMASDKLFERYRQG